MYADFYYYSADYNGKLLQEDAEKALKQASRHIDTLTYNRIKGVGFENLTDFQKEVVKESVCMMADFENENGELINSLINSYSLNGASISFGSNSANCTMIGGIVVQRDTYEYLKQTGLCCASLGV